MQTIRLRVNDKVYKYLMWFLSKFNKEEIQIIEENREFISVKDYLSKELIKVDKGTIEYFDFDELDNDLENTIRKYEA